MLVEKLQGIFVYFNIFEYVEIVQKKKNNLLILYTIKQ